MASAQEDLLEMSHRIFFANGVWTIFLSLIIFVVYNDSATFLSMKYPQINVVHVVGN